MEKLEHMEKIADLFTAKDRHGKPYLVSTYENNIVYYVFKNDFHNTNNADYTLYAKQLYVKRKSKPRKRKRRDAKSRALR